MNNRNNSFEEPARVIRRPDAPEETVYSLTFREAVSRYFRTHFSKKAFRDFIKNSFPHKGDSGKEIARKLIMDISFVLLVAGLSYMVFYYFSYRERIEELKNWEVTIENFDDSQFNEGEKKKMWQELKSQYPDVEFPEGMSLKFASLYAVNQDTVGVLSIPEKELWTPIMQNKQYPTYYLWKDMYGEYNRYGNPYADYRCNLGNDSLSTNTIIYGHNTHDKLGFNKLTTYMTLAGYKEAPVITLETLYEKTEWKIFGVILTNSTASADRGHLFTYLVTDFASTGDFSAMLNGISERTIIKTGVDVNTSDKVLTLYTCYQDIFEGGRLVVFARQVRDGESAEVDTSKAYYNSNARYPQAYYDELSMTNPYEHLTTPIEWVTDENGELYPVPATTLSETEAPSENSSQGDSGEEPAGSVSSSENVTEPPVIQEEPTVGGDIPPSDEEPSVTEPPVSGEAPSVSEAPPASEAPSASEAPPASSAAQNTDAPAAESAAA